MTEPAFPYIVLTPRGKLTVLDATRVASGGHGGFPAQVRSLLGARSATTALDSIYGRVAAIHEEDADLVDGIAANPVARMIVSVLGGAECDRGGVHVFCGIGPDDVLTGLSPDQLHLLCAAADRVRAR